MLNTRFTKNLGYKTHISICVIQCSLLGRKVRVLRSDDSAPFNCSQSSLRLAADKSDGTGSGVMLELGVTRWRL